MKTFKELKPGLKCVLPLFLITTCSYFAASQQQNSNLSIHNRIDSVLQQTKEIDYEFIAAIQGVNHQLPLSGYFFKNLSAIPYFSETVSNQITGAKYNIQTLFHYSFQMMSAPAGGFGPPLQGTSPGFSVNAPEELNHFFERTDIKLVNKNEWEKLPYPFKKGIVELLVSIDEANGIFKQFSEPVQEYLKSKRAFNSSEIYDELIIPWDKRELVNLCSIDLIKQVDLKKLAYASRKLTEKLDWFLRQKELSFPDDFKSCSIRTPMGELLVNGTKNDTIRGAYFFVIELGGNDVYLENTASSIAIDKPVSIVVDLKGDDNYLCRDHFLAAAILGVAVLLDLDGDDYYHTNKPGLAFSLYGSSLLYDYAGNDVYIGTNRSQAAAYVGSSLLIDISGDDKYYCRMNSQAFGGTLGVGILVDNIGNDHYNTMSITATERSHQQNFVLGTAQGRWAEATDGQSLAGGIGIFIDNSGTDEYGAGSFALGASYYFGLGIFNDREGDDTYNTISHSQGYAAHYSLACFFEQKGDDTYNELSEKDKLTQIIGGGRDYSAGLFIEADGNDTYHFGNRSAGTGDIYGVGLLYDFEGDDEYTWHKNLINSGSPSRGTTTGLEKGMNIGFKVFQPLKAAYKGIFIDSNGNNTYK